MAYHIKYENREKELSDSLLKKIKVNRLKKIIPFICNRIGV